MPGAEKKWDSNAERDLCLSIIMGNQEGERARHNWPRVHSLMSNLGYNFTKDAISQHFTKTVMKDFKGRHGDELANDSPAPATTPKKKATPRKRATPAKPKKSKATVEDDDLTEDENLQTPSKKAKLEVDDDVKVEDDVPLSRERSVTAPQPERDEDFEAWVKADGETSEE